MKEHEGPAAVFVFDRRFPYADEGRVTNDFLTRMGLHVKEGKIYSTVQPGILTDQRHLLIEICRMAFPILLGAAYREDLLEVTPFGMEDGTGGIIVYHP